MKDEHKIGLSTKPGEVGIYGAWVDSGEGDVHTYTNAPRGQVVLGLNKSNKDKQWASELAIVISEKEIVMQVVTETGVAFLPVDRAKFVAVYTKFLNEMRDAAAVTAG